MKMYPLHKTFCFMSQTEKILPWPVAYQYWWMNVIIRLNNTDICDSKMKYNFEHMFYNSVTNSEFISFKDKNESIFKMSKKLCSSNWDLLRWGH